MRIGFYAPLKSPDHPIPSGDRAMARALVSLLGELGHEVTTICRLRSYDRSGNPLRQKRIKNLGRRAVRRLSTRKLHLDLLFTYHLYHKAPDWLGGPLSRIWNIPYLIAEASIAGKQADGPWACGHHAVVEAVGQADHVFALTKIDAEALGKHVANQDRLSLLRPFTTIPGNPPKRGINGAPRLLTVAMMRDDVKLASYRLLAKALAKIEDLPWRLDIVGDGPVRGEVGAVFARFGGRVDFLGALPPDQLRARYLSADIFVWPGLNEAYGMVYIEAQAQGLPVVAVGEGGVPEVMIDGQTGLLCGSREPAAFANELQKLIEDRSLCQTMGALAFKYAKHSHNREYARDHLGRVLNQFEYA